MGLSIEGEKVIKELKSLRDICNAKSNMATGKGKIAWAGYANTADDAIALLKEQPEIVRCKDCKFRQSRVSRIIDGKECNFCEMVKGYKPADWYCADGKKR